MTQVRIMMHGLGSERVPVDTFYVKGYDNEKQIRQIMEKIGMDPSGWRCGYYYSAEIDPTLDSRGALEITHLETYLTA